MPLQKTEIRVPFGGGLDTKTDEKGVVPGKLIELKNGVFHELKQISKRNGFLTPYSDQTVGWSGHNRDTIEEGSAIYRRGKELMITARQTNVDTGDTTYADGWYMYTQDSDNNEWKNLGTRQPLRLGVETIVEPTGQWAIPDVAICDTNPFICYAWLELVDPADATDNRNANLTVIDMANNATIIDRWSTDATLSAVDIQGVHVVGLEVSPPEFHAWFAVPSTNDIYLSQATTVTLSTFGNPVATITDLHGDTTPLWDVCSTDFNGITPCSVVAYKESVTNQINVRWVNGTGTIVNTRLIGDGPKGAITVFESYHEGDAEYKIVVAWQSSADGKIYGYTFNADGTVYQASYVIVNVDLGDAVRNITGCRDHASDTYVANSYFNMFYVEIANNAANSAPCYCQVALHRCELDGTNRANLETQHNACLASKAWEYEEKARVWVVHDSYGLIDEDPDPDVYTPETQNTYFQISHSGEYHPDSSPSLRTDARCLGSEAYGQSFSPSLSRVVNPYTDEYLFAGLRQDVIITTQTNVSKKTHDSVVGINTEFGQVAQPSTELGPTAQTGGGYIGEADGRFQENNFHLYPEALISDVTAVGGVAVDWQYCVVYEWTDREGQIHRSHPSIPIDVSCNDQDAVDITVSCLSFGDPQRLEHTRCVLYRTVDGPGNVFYRLADSVHEYNNPTAANLILTDTGGAPRTNTDAFISQMASIYTAALIDGVWGVIGNICPPASSVMKVRQDRVFLVPDEDRTNLWFSKIKQHAVAVSFSDLFTKRVSDGGDIIALEVLDTRLIVFKESEIRAFSGNGPIDTGVGSFGEDYQITSDVGCVDRASVVWTDKGIMFKSNKGIYLLGRNLQVSYVGAPVEAYNNYTVLKAELVENKNQVRFLLEDYYMLVYDYLVNQWSVFEGPHTGEAPYEWGTVDSAIWQNNYVMIHNDGTVYREGVTWVDITDTYIPLDFTTSWIKLAGMQGYQRIWWVSLLGEVYNTCTLTVEFMYDYVDTVAQTTTVTVDAALAAAPPAQVRIKPTVQKCEAIKIRVYDAQAAVPAGSQQGFSLSDIMLQVGKKRKGILPQGGAKTR